MGTRKLTLQGPCMWAKVFPDNRDMQGFEGSFVDCEGAYSINVILDKESIDELKASGSMKRGSVVDDGTSVKFTRKHKDRFEWASGAPTVCSALDEREVEHPWDFEEDGPIPNGSIVEVELSVYDTKYSKCGTRLESVTVLEVAEMEEPKAPVEDSEEVPF